MSEPLCDPVGVAYLAQITGLTVETARQYATRPPRHWQPFPAPVMVAGNARLWPRSVLDEWNRQRLAGRTDTSR